MGMARRLVDALGMSPAKAVLYSLIIASIVISYAYGADEVRFVPYAFIFVLAVLISRSIELVSGNGNRPLLRCLVWPYLGYRLFDMLVLYGRLHGRDWTDWLIVPNVFCVLCFVAFWNIGHVKAIEGKH